MKQFLCLALLVLSMTGVSGQQENSVRRDVTVTGGAISGKKTDDGIFIYKGIPFAAPPVKDLRWKAPQPVKPWTGVRECTDFGPSAMQAPPVPFAMWSKEYLIHGNMSEDCLYLNVWTGAQSKKEKRPVLVWIYGGAFTGGGADVPIYDGLALAKKGIIVVSFNYRVGIFGFFVHPELTKESSHHASGNYGLMDQIAALQWVKNNILSFGGDPDNVTIAGQSAGSMSVNCLVASPLAKGLFVKAIAESGARFVNGGFELNTLAAQEQIQLRAIEKIKYSSLADLRNDSAGEMLAIPASYGPVIDGYVLPDQIATIFSQGKENKVSLMTGWNEDEGFVFGPTAKASEFRTQASKYQTDSALFLKNYPAATDQEAAASQKRLSRDMMFGVQNYAWANVETKQGQKVYVYRFTRKLPYADEKTNFGSFHTGEVPYVFDNLKFVDRPWTKTDETLANTMSSYWVNFVSTGDPNGKGLPVWPRYEISSQKIMDLGSEIRSKTLPDAAALNFLYEKTK